MTILEDLLKEGGKDYRYPACGVMRSRISS